MIANVRYEHKKAFFQYLRKKSRWQDLFDHVDSLVQKPVKYDKEKLVKKPSILQLENIKDHEQLKGGMLSLKPIDTNRKLNILCKIVACFASIWALLIITTQTTLIWDPSYTLINWLVNSQP